MASTINATPTSSGLIQTADNSGVLALQTGGTTAVTVDGSQNVGIGLTTPDSKLHISSTGVGAVRLLYNNTSVNYFDADLNIFRNKSNTEAMRIDSSGNVGIGTSSGGERLKITSPDNAVTLYAQATNASYSQSVIDLQASRNTTNSSYYFISGTISGVQTKFRIADSGNMLNVNNSYGALSDETLKENIVDATPKLDSLMDVKIRNFNLIKGDHSKQIGVVAQELETVFPSMVETDPEGIKSVKYSVFVPMLIKAIQELKAQVDAQALEIQALKGVAP